MQEREHRSSPGRSRKPQASEAAATTPPVLELGQTAGNRALARAIAEGALVARQQADAPPLTDQAEEEYHQAIERQDWITGARLLDAEPPDEAERFAELVPVTEDLMHFQFVAMIGGRDNAANAIGAVLARPPHADRVRAIRLETDWAQARASENWYDLARLLVPLSDADVENRLNMLNLSELEKLVDETKGPHAAELARLAEPAERHRARKHVEMCRFAIDNSQWPYATMLLNGLSDADQETFVQGLTDAQTAAIAPLVYVLFDDHNRLYSRINFRQHRADLASAHATSATGMTTGGAGAPANVDGGTATTSTNDTDSSGTSAWFGQDYSGPDAVNMGWLQFLAREAEKFDDQGNSLGFDTSLTTFAQGQAEPRHWGTTSEPYWTIDTFGATLPFYDSPDAGGGRGASGSSATQQAMFDRPEPNAEVSTDAFDTWFWETTVDHVVMRYRFVDYLVHGREVVQKSEVTVIWTFTDATKGTSPPRTNLAGGAGAANKLTAPHYEALVRRFPTWRYFAHD